MFSAINLSNGRKYYNEGWVRRIQKKSVGEFTAKVEDKFNQYTVKIHFLGGDEVTTECNCFNPDKCSHIAAAMYKLDEMYGVNSIADEMDAKINNISPFKEPEDYQYFNLCKITRGEDFSKENNDKARKFVQKGEVVIDNVETGYISTAGKLCVNIYGYYQAKNSAVQNEIFVQMNSYKILNKDCNAKGCNSKYYYYYYNNSKLDTAMCPHLVALLMLFEEYQKTHILGDDTDYAAAVFLGRYRKKRINSQAEGEFASNNFHIEPKLEISNGDCRLKFRIGTDKLYAVKNLTTLVDDVESGNIMKLGTKNELNFAVSSVAEDSKMIFEYVKGVVHDVEKFEGNRKQYNYMASYEVKDSIELYGNRIDDFFDIYSGKNIPFENKDSGAKSSVISFRDKNPKCNLNVKKYMAGNEFQGITVSGQFPNCIEGNRSGYYITEDNIKGNYLNRFSRKQMELLHPLAELERAGKVSFNVGRNHLAEFFYKVLPELSQAVEVEQFDSDIIEQYLPPEARFSFFLDAENGNVTCGVEAKYGDLKIGLQELLTRDYSSKIRDYELESRVVNELNQIFPAVNEDNTMFHCANDEDVIYYVLKNGVDRLMALGTVNSTDGFKRLTYRNKFKIRVGVSIQSDIMNLDISSDDISREELVDILNSYKKKKKYHRLKNGDFINLDDETIDSLGEMLDNLQITPNEFVKGKMKIPVYRALYLDRMLENNSNIYADRDKNFKKLIKEFKTVDDSDFEVPKSIEGTMRKYQIHGYRWMRTIASYGFGGILADDMGLGKTLQMISVILASKMERTDSDGQAVSIIICPASLVYNWQEEFRRFAPMIDTQVVAGTQTERQNLINDYAGHDVLITSYDLLKRDIDLYEEINFLYEVIDEAQYIKTHTTAASKAVKLINASKRFALTGTPIENRLSELWSIFDYLMPGYLYDYETFKKEIENQIVKYKNEAATIRLKRMVSPFILRRLKGDVLKDLPAKLEEIRYAKLDDEQQKIYDGQVVHMKNMIETQNESDFQKNKIKILAELTKIRQICCNPSLLFENYKGDSAKTQACMDLIETAHEGGHKMLVFSQFTSMLAILERELDERKIAYYKITGETKKEKRIELVNQFNQDDTPVFLISLKAGGTGLNLTGADIVIHYDPWWNVAVQNQATDRAHRIGQTKTVSVYKLIVKNSIEEKIIKMQEDKKNLADEILSGEMGSIGQMSKEDLLELIG
jgi:SNF2 family DNA or RNA helicase